jgi:hypothetical protein
MQAASAKKDATKMGDQGYTGFLNIVDQATRMSWVNLLRVIGQPDDCLSAAIKMIRAVRQSYYNDPEDPRWPVPKMLCVVDFGKEFSQTFRTGFAAELGPQVEVKWQNVPAGNPNAGAGQTENSTLALAFFIRVKRCRYTPIVFSIYSAFPLILRRSLS